MPRNGSGSYSIPNTFQPNTTITSASVNQNFDDVGNALTDSLARDGQGGMTGQFKAAIGSAALPSMAFASDTDTGFWRKAANIIGISAGGAEIAEINSNGVSIAAGKTLLVNGSTLIPVGLGPLPWSGLSVPAGWLLCYGQAVSRTTYAALFTAIGTTYGAGDGSLTFNLPDMRGRVAAGRDNMGGTAAGRLTNKPGGVDGATLGAAGGSEENTLTASQMPKHDHTFTGNQLPPHTHNASTTSGGTLIDNRPGSSFGGGGVGNITGISISSSSAGTPSGSISEAGGGQAHNNVQPTLITDYIIYAGV